jgi:hypothetical protein
MESHLTNRPRACASLLQKLFFGMLLLGLTVTAYAVPITGSIGMGGNFIAVDDTWATTGTASATGVDFDPNLFIVNSTSGSFTSVSSTIGNITDFQFDPGLGINDGSGGVTSVSSIVDFWTIDGFSFELTSVAKGFTNDPNTFLVLEGAGMISGNGFDATSGTWSFTGDTTNGGTFSWSAGSATVAAPGSLVLLSIGLFGMVGRRYL